MQVPLSHIIFHYLFFSPNILSSFSIRYCSYDVSPVLRAPADCEQHNRPAGLHQSHLHTDGLFCCSSWRGPVDLGTWLREMAPACNLTYVICIASLTEDEAGDAESAKCNLCYVTSSNIYDVTYDVTCLAL